MSELEKLQTAQAEYMAALSAVNKIKPQNFSVYFGNETQSHQRHEVLAKIDEDSLVIRWDNRRENSIEFSLADGMELLGALKKLYEEPTNDAPKA
jgi:hypothetical protein